MLRYKLTHVSWLAIILWFPSTSVADGAAPSGHERSTAVLVFGATPAGIAAAISASKAGKDVLLVDPTDRIGGLLTSGLSNTDFRSFESLSGFFLDFSERVQAAYEREYGAVSPQATAAFRGTHGEPSVNLRVLKLMLKERKNVAVALGHRLTKVVSGPLKRGRSRIHAVEFIDGAGRTLLVRVQACIDASYEGDLMAMAGEPYHVGRESRRQYGEAMAGNERGEADGQVQGYNLRLIMTNVISNQRPRVAPPGYAREHYLGALPHFKEGRLKKVFSPDRDGVFRAHEPLLPNGKTDINDTPRAPIRLSMPDINDHYPDGDAAVREEIVAKHFAYNLGLLYFLQTDEAVPAEIRRDAQRWGFCRDEFPDTQGISPKLYIREARRLIGQHVYTEQDTKPSPGDARTVLHRQSIAIGDYVHNCHGTGRVGTRFDGAHSGEFYKPVSPYQIPYGVIVPSKHENLLVPVACSASHFGFGAIRLEPIWCSLGQAAGWGAALALDRAETVQELDASCLQEKLHHDQSATIYVSDVGPHSALFVITQRLGTRGGLHGLAEPNQPRPQSIVGQYTRAFPGHAVELEKTVADTAIVMRWCKLLTLDVRDAPTPQASRREFLQWAKEAGSDCPHDAAEDSTAR